jgi:hypothetical protein
MIVYKVIIVGNIIARHPRIEDKNKGQMIFSSGDQIIILKKEAILPYAILHIKRAT